jgi:hypothetical protein
VTPDDWRALREVVDLAEHHGDDVWRMLTRGEVVAVRRAAVRLFDAVKPAGHEAGVIGGTAAHGR